MHGATIKIISSLLLWKCDMWFLWQTNVNVILQSFQNKVLKTVSDPGTSKIIWDYYTKSNFLTSKTPHAVCSFFGGGGGAAPQWAIHEVSRSQITRHHSRTPLYEWSARRRDLHLTTDNTHDKHPCPRWETNPQSQQVSGRKPML